MKASEFREQFDAELERAGPRRRRAVRETPVEDSLAEITNRRLGVRRRVEAVGRAAESATRQRVKSPGGRMPYSSRSRPEEPPESIIVTTAVRSASTSRRPLSSA